MEVARFGIIVAFCLYNDLKFIRDFLKYSLVFCNGVSVHSLPYFDIWRVPDQHFHLLRCC